MTDFDYDCKQKKDIARSARCKKNGSRSKFCSLPSDNLTKKELKAMSGEVIVHQTNKPLDWEAYLKLPADLKKQYLEVLVNEYGATGKQVAEMLGVTPSTLSRNIKQLHGFTFRGSKRQTEAQAEAWRRFLSGESKVDAAEPEQTPVNEPTAAEPEQPEVQRTPPVYEPDEEQKSGTDLPFLVEVNMECETLFSVSNLMTALKALDGVSVRAVHIDWRTKDQQTFLF